ncbi:hypothetical protein [Faecalibacter macacae]|uniref:Uncharacterized protein n=1 Tax=Faecalibacter macacae TaxID=1859289 RepID=A0A3L9M9I4_9FLAO|nr:hypothetical protein [Faecalibacter macacae]RLZ08606.1 hypothetical protein EAH69_09845 [Faecalibacter macacae]
MKEFFAPYISELLTGVVAAIIAWVSKSKVTRKVEDAELTKHIQAIYKDMIADTDRLIDQNTKEISELKLKLVEKDLYWEKKIQEVESKWSNKYNGLQRENNTLKKRISELEKHP